MIYIRGGESYLKFYPKVSLHLNRVQEKNPIAYSSVVP